MLLSYDAPTPLHLHLAKPANGVRPLRDRAIAPTTMQIARFRAGAE